MADQIKTKKHAGWLIRYYPELKSTNTEAKSMKALGADINRTVIMAECQSEGRGQGVNSWHSEKGKNLLFSAVMNVSFKAEHFFLINVFVSLAIRSFLQKLGIQAQVKWPNDIYVGDSKICGVLIENSLNGSLIKESVIGIGLNVNQMIFPDSLPNPTSMKLITGKNYNLDELIELLLDQLEAMFEELSVLEVNEWMNRYKEALYRRDLQANYESQGHRFKAAVSDVLSNGILCLKHTNGQVEQFQFGEVSYLI